MIQHDKQFLDDLAAVMRRARHGLIRPLWAELPEDEKAAERLRAANLLRFLETHNFTIQRIDKPRQEKAEC